MQVSVCHLRTKANQATGIFGFHKNVICFPQAGDDLEAFNMYLSSLQVGDAVNIQNGTEPLRRAKVSALHGTYANVEFDDGTIQTVEPLSLIHI